MTFKNQGVTHGNNATNHMNKLTGIFGIGATQDIVNFGKKKYTQIYDKQYNKS